MYMYIISMRRYTHTPMLEIICVVIQVHVRRKLYTPREYLQIYRVARYIRFLQTIAKTSVRIGGKSNSKSILHSKFLIIFYTCDLDSQQ